MNAQIRPFTMLVALWVVAAVALPCVAFTTTTSRRYHVLPWIQQQQHLSIHNKATITSLPSTPSFLFARSEFTVDEDDDNVADDTDSSFATDFSIRAKRNAYGDLMIVNEDSVQQNEYATEDSNQPKQRQKDRPTMEYGYLRPGTVVRIQIGDLNLARKAWKKRRRTGSPLLVPCSVLNVDRLSMVRWNLLFLLEKFGRTVANSKNDPGIEISLVSLARTYRTFLKSSLNRQVDALEFESAEEMLSTVFNKKIQESYGIILEERTEKDGSSMLYLTAPISRTRAQKRVANAPMMQFRLHQDGDYGDSDTLTHTGFVRALKEYKDDEERDYEYLPLSAAIRVSQKEDIDSGRVVEGSVFAAVIFDYDRIGDGGSPLLTLTLDPGNVREQLKFKDDRWKNVIQKPKVLLGDLTVGDGPFKAKVIKMEKGRAVVDFGVGRPVRGIGDVKVLGSLQFKDAVELAFDPKKEKRSVKTNSRPRVEYDDEDEDQYLKAGSIDELYTFDDDDGEDGFDDEEDGKENEIDTFDDLTDELLALRKDAYVEDGEVEEDISHLFETNENGELMYKDPDSGELTMLEEGDEIFEADDDEEDIESGKQVDDGEVDLDGAYEDISDEDLSSLVTLNEDGSLTFTDPETGEAMVVEEDDEEYQDMMTMKSLVDKYLLPTTAASNETKKRENQMPDQSNEIQPSDQKSKRRPRLKKKFITVGDYVNVYVLDVSKQSKQLRVTTNPLIQGQGPKEIKKEGAANKKLSRLSKQVGSLNNILTLKGKRVHGVVKASSKTGDWVYVQPLYEKRDLPVGIGALVGEGLDDLAAGDYVECVLDGVDEERGQLSLQVLHKLDGPPKKIVVNKAVKKRKGKDTANTVP
jgi:hypothetical protein